MTAALALADLETRSGAAPADHPEWQYLNLLRDILDNGVRRDDRTGTGTLGVFGRQIRFDLSKGFPLLTTKKLHTRSIFIELLWFLRGETNIGWLKDNGVGIWDEMGRRERRPRSRLRQAVALLGRPNGQSIDQIQKLIHGLKTNPNSRRHIVSAWNPADVDDMALPPCHCLFQFLRRRRQAELPAVSAQRRRLPRRAVQHRLLRPADHDAGPGRGAGARRLRPHASRDAHLYLNHLEQAELQLTRQPLPLPTPDRRAEKPTCSPMSCRTSCSATTRPGRTSRPPSRSRPHEDR